MVSEGGGGQGSDTLRDILHAGIFGIRVSTGEPNYIKGDFNREGKHKGGTETGSFYSVNI